MQKDIPMTIAASSLAWRDWLASKALPLWTTSGFDPRRNLFHERLSWDGTPIRMDALRLMVQARQVATCYRASLDGLYDATSKAEACLETMERLYHRRDGAPGWVFSIGPDDRPADCRRDLYAHAFVLYACAWSIRSGGPVRLARETADEIRTIFAAHNDGFLDAVPPVDNLRRQNPHMHLLEAYLALFEATQDEFYLAEAREMAELALRHLIEPRSGLLLEFFDADWKPAEKAGSNRVEPGHLFEWSWLLGEYLRLASPDATKTWDFRDAAEHLYQVGAAKGRDRATGLVFDAMTEDGDVFEHSTRIWPQTELIRLLCQRAKHQGGMLDEAAQLGERFLSEYAPDRLNGGWVDRLDASGAPLVDYMPASSLYHIYNAGREFIL